MLVSCLGNSSPNRRKELECIGTIVLKLKMKKMKEAGQIKVNYQILIILLKNAQILYQFWTDFDANRA